MPATPAVSRLIYRSRATPPFSEAALDALLRKARQHNQAHRLSGLLLYIDGQFLQVIEGPEPALSRLYGLIERDPRHTDVRTLFYGPVPARAFPDWRMGYAAVSPAALERATGFLPLAATPGLAAHPPAELEELLRAFAKGQVVDECKIERG